MAFAPAALLAKAGSSAPPRDEKITLEKIEVTSTRAKDALALGAPASFLETPLSTSTVTTATLLEQGGTTLNDALRNVPGAQADFSFVGSHSSAFILRGSIAESGTQSSRILRDGARLSNYAFTPAFVERLDVVRGPGAAAATRTEPGGTVELVTKSPQLQNFATAYARLGEHAAQEFWLDANRVLSTRHGLAARLVFVRSAESEWRHVEDQLDGLKLGLSLAHADRYRFAVDFEGTNHTYQPDFGIPAVNNRVIDVPADRQLGEPFAKSKTDNRIYSAHADVRLAPTTRLAAAFTHLDGKSDSIRNSVFSVAAGQPLGTFNRVTAYEPGATRDIDSVALSLTSVQTTGAFTHHLCAGAEYYTEDLYLVSLRVPPANNPAINVFTPVYGLVTAPTGTLVSTLTTEALTNYLFTVQDRVEVGDFDLVAGLQYVDQDFLYGVIGTLPNREKHFAPKFAVTYALSKTQSLYASSSAGFASNQVSTVTNQSVGMRRSRQLEAGWKAQLLGGRLQTDLAVFRLDHSNLLTPDGSVLGRFSVNGKGRSQGVEASATGRVTDRLSLNFAYAYTDSKFLELSAAPGKRIPNAARHSLSLFGQYRWDRAWRTGLGVYVQSGGRFADEFNTTPLPGYARWDAVQSYAFTAAGHAVELQLNVKNLLDQRYWAASHLHVNRYILPGEGRTFSASLLYRF